MVSGHMVSTRHVLTEDDGMQRYVELQRAAFVKQATTGKAEEENSLAEDAADAQAQTETYSGAVGQKQRREVMAEVWERVHAAADLLIGPLLDDGSLHLNVQRKLLSEFT